MMEEINTSIASKCVICSANTEFTTECKCRICQNCLFSQIASQNYSTISKKNEGFQCPNSQCKKQISHCWIYSNLSQIQINCINEILFHKFLEQSSEMKKCQNEYCSYFGWVPRNEKCNDYLYCDLCKSKWTDPSLLYYDYFFRIYILLSMTIWNMINAFKEVKAEFLSIKCLWCEQVINSFNGFCLNCHRSICTICLEDHGGYNSLKSTICCWKVIHRVLFFGLFLLCGFIKLSSFYYLRICSYYFFFGVIYNFIFLAYGWALFGLLYLIFYEYFNPYYSALHPVAKILSFFGFVGILSVHIYSYLNFALITSMTHIFIVELIILGIGYGIGFIIYHIIYPTRGY